MRCPNGYARYFCCVGLLVLRFRNFCGGHFLPAHFRSAGRDNLPGSLKRSWPAGSNWLLYHFVLKGHAFGIVFRKPGLRGIGVREDLEVIAVSDLT